MTDDSILKQVVKGLGEVGEETLKETVNEAITIGESVITGKELLGDIKTMDEGEMAQKKAEEERKKQEELAKIRNIPGRNVEGEIKQVVQEKKSEEEEKEREFLEKIKEQREAEERERQQMEAEEPGNAKREAAKKQMAPGKKKSSQPDTAAMSQTSEFKGGKID